MIKILKRYKQEQKSNLPENYSDSLHFLERMFVPAFTIAETTIIYPTQIDKKQRATEIKFKSDKKNKKNPVAKLTNIPNPITKFNLLIFIVLLIILTTIFSAIFISIFAKDTATNDSPPLQESEQETIYLIEMGENQIFDWDDFSSTF